MTQTDTDRQPDAASIATPKRWRARASWIVDSDVLAARVHAHALAHRIGLSAVFSLETAHDMDSADMLDFLATDPHTQSVFLVVSGIDSPARWMSAARACTRLKPVFAWCVRPVHTDTDANNGTDANTDTYAAAIDRTGFVLADNIEQLLEWSELAEAQGLHVGALIERYRARMARLMAMPPLPSQDVRGLREAHARAQQRVDRLLVHAAQGHDWLEPHDAQALLGDFGLHVTSAQPADGVVQDAQRCVIEVAIQDDPTFGAYMTITAPGSPGVAHLLPVDTALVFDTLEAMTRDTARGEVGEVRDAVAVRDPAEGCERDDRREAQRPLASAAYSLERLSSMICGEPRIAACTTRLVASDRACVFEDVRIRISPAARENPLAIAPFSIDVETVRHRPLSIEPYPFDVEETIDWVGTALTFRPIRPEDEPLIADLFRAQSPEDLYLRFFSMQRAPDHARLARLVRIDYAREMAIVACSGSAAELVVHGVARAVSEPSGESAEFAVAIRSDEKGHHLGRLLMDRLIAYCRQHGMARLDGIVLKENHRMLALAQDCGFERRANDDPTLWSIVLELHPKTA